MCVPAQVVRTFVGNGYARQQLPGIRKDGGKDGGRGGSTVGKRTLGGRSQMGARAA